MGGRGRSTTAARRLLLLCCAILATGCIGQKGDPPCPLDMDKVLPLATFTGNIRCINDGNCESLKDKVALITGASTGLGRGIADKLASVGMKVVGTSRTPDAYSGTCTYSKPGDRCKPSGWQLWQMDQTSEDSVKALMQKVKDTYGRIDLLVLNAARGYGSNTFLGKCNDISQMKLLMDTNFFGPISVILAAMPLIPRDGYARIINTVSTATWVNIQGGLPYAASKAAADVIGEEWLYEYFGSRAGNIKFIQLYPGAMLSDIARKSVPACPGQSEKGDNKDLKESEWKSWEAGQYNKGDNFVIPSQGGEAVYRLALEPSPLKRYFLNAEKGVNFMRRRICTHLAAPMDVWPKAYD